MFSSSVAAEFTCVAAYQCSGDANNKNSNNNNNNSVVPAGIRGYLTAHEVSVGVGVADLCVLKVKNVGFGVGGSCCCCYLNHQNFCSSKIAFYLHHCHSPSVIVSDSSAHACAATIHLGGQRWQWTRSEQQFRVVVSLGVCVAVSGTVLSSKRHPPSCRFMYVCALCCTGCGVVSYSVGVNTSFFALVFLLIVLIMMLIMMCVFYEL